MSWQRRSQVVRWSPSYSLPSFSAPPAPRGGQSFRQSLIFCWQAGEGLTGQMQPLVATRTTSAIGADHGRMPVMVPRKGYSLAMAAAGSLAHLFTLDPEVTFLNHGSFGACPAPVLAAQSEWRARLEREPVRFMVRDLERLLDEARGAVAGFVGADGEDLAFVPNATTGANLVLHGLTFQPGDEILRTDHGYNAVNNAIDAVCARTGAREVVASLPFPHRGPGSFDDAVVDAVLAQVTDRTRLAVLDHITSPTGMILPIERLVEVLAVRGVDTLVDGAHGPGQVALELRELDAAYYVGNFHKWCCAPKGAAMLHVRRDRQEGLRPLVVSHGRNSPRKDRSRFRLDLDWVGTVDPTPFLSVPIALATLERALPGGWPMIRELNHALALAARRLLAESLGVPVPCPDSAVGAMAALPLPDAPRTETPVTALYADALQDRLVEHHHIQVPIVPWPRPPARLIRVSAHIYNRPDQYAFLAAALEAELAREIQG
jgi:isopenicillin-N epimerase